jgi:biotin synthase-like enzyme
MKGPQHALLQQRVIWHLSLQLATLPEHPESVPINALVAVAGTPLEVCPVPLVI